MRRSAIEKVLLKTLTSLAGGAAGGGGVPRGFGLPPECFLGFWWNFTIIQQISLKTFWNQNDPA